MQNGPLGSLVRVEKTDFLLPMYVGEVAHLSAEITYCSEHSLEVKVYVEAENLFTGLSSFCGPYVLLNQHLALLQIKCGWNEKSSFNCIYA